MSQQSDDVVTIGTLHLTLEDVLTLRNLKAGTHVVVPVEPTPEMLRAASDWVSLQVRWNTVVSIYRAMLAAAQKEG